MQDLNTLIPAGSNIVLTSAIGINKSSWSLAIGVVATDRSQPVG